MLKGLYIGISVGILGNFIVEYGFKLFEKPDVYGGIYGFVIFGVVTVIFFGLIINFWLRYQGYRIFFEYFKKTKRGPMPPTV